MSLFGDLLKYFGVSGSTVRDVPGTTTPDPANLRRLRCDDQGFLITVGGGPPVVAPIYGVAGDDTALNPFRQIDFIPQGGGFRDTLVAASREVGPLTVDKTYHITASVDAWVLVGPTGGTAVVGDVLGNGTTHIKGGSTYEYVAKAGRDYVQFLKDTSEPDGYIAVTRVEV